MLIISFREFRENQKSYLDRIDKGAEILIKRSKNKSYKIIPVTDDDMLMSKDEFLNKINLSLQQIEMGNFTTLTSKQDITNFLNAL